MKKIPTLFTRDHTDPKHPITRVIDPLLLAAVANARWTAKLDGAAVCFRNAVYFKRRTVKTGRLAPVGFIEEERDDATGNVYGWAPVIPTLLEDGPFLRAKAQTPGDLLDGTYEAIGPSFQGNPHGADHDHLVAHGTLVLADAPQSLEFDVLREYLAKLTFEGVVWWDEHGPVAKLKRKDFGLNWPVAVL